jgi:hypothetical protein
MEPGLLARLARWTSAVDAGSEKPHRTEGEGMTETRSCEYNVQDASDSVGRVCGKKGVKRATTSKLDFVYCKMHFQVAEGALKDYKAKVEDYGEED